MTPQGHTRLKEELHRLKHVEVPENIKDIETARAHGDLRENAEYHAAKERQSHLAGRIAYLEGRVTLAEVIDPSKITTDRVAFGATVTIENVDTEENLTYQIVGEDESDPAGKRISIKSPMARAMLGKQEDDEFVLKTSAGTKEYLIISIEYK